MLKRLVESSRITAEERKGNLAARIRMKAASLGQAPRFLLISPISRSFQDIDLLGFSQGDAFYASRVPDIPLSSRDQLPFLLGGPISYNEQFSAEDGIIVTFEMNEAYAAVRTTISNLSSYTETRRIPIIGIRVDYALGRGLLVPHDKGRNYALENKIMSMLRKPRKMDHNTLILVCSDSRIVLSDLPIEAPMAIRTLGGYIPQYDADNEETQLLDGFFEKWFSSDTSAKQIVILSHGSSESNSASCGAADASLRADEHGNGTFGSILGMMNIDAGQHEEELPTSPKERAINITKATLQNLRSYPSLIDASEKGFDIESRIEVMFIDTVTNLISELGASH
ncbi:MAG: hypothetical protein ACFFD6_02295 [Candidatus Thorarchaeota archaeon]